jgi:small-conductance mechanosensitive channel
MTLSRNRRSKRPLHRSTVIALLGLMTVLPLAAQEPAQPVTTPVPTPTATPSAIAAADIPARAEKTGTLIRDIQRRAGADTTADNISEQLGKEQEVVEALEEKTADELDREAPRSLLDDTDKLWQRTENRLEGWIQALGQRVSIIDNDRARLDRERTEWEETSQEAGEADLPPAVVEQVREVLRSIRNIDKQLADRRERLLTLQASVSELKARVIEARRLIGEAIAEREQSLYRRDQPPLWIAMRQQGVSEDLASRMSDTRSGNLEAIRAYVRDESGQVVAHCVIFIFVLLLILFYRRRVQIWVRQDASLEQTARLLERPVAGAMVLSVLLGEWIHPRAPQAWVQLLGLVLLIAILRLLPRMLPANLRSGLYMLVVFYVLHRLLQMIPGGTLLNRLVLLVLCVVACGGFVWLARQLTRTGEPKNSGWSRAVTAAARLAAAIFAAAIVANFFGMVALATLLETGTLTGFFWAILLWAGAQLLRGMVAAELKTTSARGLRMVQFHADAIRRALWRLITVVTVFLWLVTTLDGFLMLETVRTWLRAAIEAEFTIIGNVTLVPINFVVFPLVIWLSFRLSRFLRFVLENDVLPRVELARGVPAAVSKGTHYVVVLIGFVIAALAAEIPLDRLTIIIGALGVGIGFGMQNIVNNFISGLILLFERPIQVGDIIQFGGLSGRVTDIGIRASMVRTWQGADVIVPNANLISSEVTNWTLSDQLRRIEIPVNVAYGSDPERVMELLVGVADAHDEVLDDPKPYALFKGFGESALEFELRCWTTEDFLRVGSELTVEISRSFAGADITIPFPQRDLHLRSVDTTVSTALAAQRRVQEDETEPR